MQKCFTILLFSIVCSFTQAQVINVPMDNDLLWRYQSVLNESGNSFHTSIKPYLYTDIKSTIDLDKIDSSYIGYKPTRENYFTRKFFNENLVSFDKDLLHFTLDPILNLQYGKDFQYNNTGHLNTRGFLLQGSIGKNLYFKSGYYEDEIKPLQYQNIYITNHSVVPGYGLARNLAGGRYDYGMGIGTLTYFPTPWLTLQAGHDKNFIGDGYRSLLLSDLAFNYPYFKAIFTYKKWKYQYLLAQMQYISNRPRYEDAFLTKNITTHYVSWNATEWLSLGFFNATIWHIDTLAGLSFKDANYFTPVPYSQSLYSPLQQKVITGINFKIRPYKPIVLYGQFVADDPTIRQLSEPENWYANKIGYQLGAKYFNVFSIKNLHLQFEYNTVRPYTYAANNTVVPPLSYTHYNEPLAHPLGANFKELISIIHYSHKAFYAENKFIYAIKGDNTGAINYGGDLFFADGYTNQYGNTTTQGQRNSIIFNDCRIGYLVNPKNGFAVEAGIIERQQQSTAKILKETYLYIGLKMSMSNVYFDF